MGLSKVLEVTVTFWVIKIAATTFGETGGDAVSITLYWDMRLGSALFIGIFVVAAAAQISAHRSLSSFLYWFRTDRAVFLILVNRPVVERPQNVPRL